MKYCSYCKTTNEKFYTNKARKDGLDVYCIKCTKVKTKAKQDNKVKDRLKEQFIEGEI